MPRSSNQKFKPLYLSRILLERTDENNVLTAPQLIDALAAYDIPATRKSIYDDIEALQLFGLDVILKSGQRGGYFIGKRDFELPELKLLVDAVQSSRLITGKKSGELIKKLSKLTSNAQAKQLNRQVYVAGRAKALNEAVYYNIDAIHAAINDNRKISFTYFEYNTKKVRVYRKNKEAYVRTPIAMCWNDDNYYLVTYSPKFDDPFATYRVDRMGSVDVLDEDADKHDPKEFNIVEYAKQKFGMYSGATVNAHIAFDNSLVSVVLDHFGNDTRLTDNGDGRFSIKTDVSASPVFLGWIFQFGGKAEILAPETLRNAMREEIAKAGTLYN
jgi:predicted DNA-binding transcriptional regulator YafY